jgi:hypothetical protein
MATALRRGVAQRLPPRRCRFRRPAACPPAAAPRSLSLPLPSSSSSPPLPGSPPGDDTRARPGASSAGSGQQCRSWPRKPLKESVAKAHDGVLLHLYRPKFSCGGATSTSTQRCIVVRVKPGKDSTLRIPAPRTTVGRAARAGATARPAALAPGSRAAVAAPAVRAGPGVAEGAGPATDSAIRLTLGCAGVVTAATSGPAPVRKGTAMAALASSASWRCPA